jgi:hypothetical protein
MTGKSQIVKFHSIESFFGEIKASANQKYKTKLQIILNREKCIRPL